MNRLPGWLVALTLTIPQAVLADAQGEARFLICRNGQYGYIDQTGQEMIPPRFEHAVDFSQGLARVEIEGKQVYIDSTGRVALEPPFVLLGPFFRQGLTGVSTGFITDRSAKWGVIDKAGRVVVAPQYSHVGDFSEGLASIQTQVGPFEYQSGFIDQTGAVIIKPQFAIVWPFSGGRARVMPGSADHSDARQGFIDASGTLVVPARFDAADDFSERLAPARIGDDQAKWGYIDLDGHWAIEPRFEGAWRFSEGLAGACEQGRCGFINPDGQFAVTVPFKDAGEFSEGRAAVLIKQESSYEWGYVNRTGTMVIPPQFDVVHNFLGGLARVEWSGGKFDSRWAYIDERGNYVWGPDVCVSPPPLDELKALIEAEESGKSGPVQ